MANAFKAFSVAFGGDQFHLDRFIDEARQIKRQVLLLDGGGLSDTQLVEHCESASEEQRAIILDNAQELSGEQALRHYVEHKDPRDRSVILIAVVRADKLSEPWSCVAVKGKCQEWASIKPWRKDTYLKFIGDEATRWQITIRQEAAELLFQCTGPDLYRLANEIKKLATYVGTFQEATRQHIAEITTRTPHAEPALVAEAVLMKNPRRAMEQFSLVCLRSGEQQYGAVVAQLMKQVESTIVVKSMQEKGYAADDIASLVGINKWRFNEFVAPMARKHELRSLIRYMGQLSKLDRDVKSSFPLKRTMIEMVILSMAQN